MKTPKKTNAARKETSPVANPGTPGVADIDGLKKEAIELMAQSLGQEQEHGRLELEGLELNREIERLRSQLQGVIARGFEARDSAAVLRLRAGGKFRAVQEALLPSKSGWTMWMKEIRASHGWKESTIREAINLHELAGGDESKVKGMTISGAIAALKFRQQRDEEAARERSERSKRAAATRKANAERLEAARGAAAEDEERTARAGQARRRLSEAFGPNFDAAALDGQDAVILAGMIKDEVPPGLARLRTAWSQATEADRDAFLLWIKGAGR
jgi:hypothetical protein